VIVGIAGSARHAHQYWPGQSSGYFGRLQAIQNVSAVTAACLMVRKDVFHKVGGFDERFTLDYNDVDLCLRIRDQGYLIVWTPYAELYHYESKTRVDNKSSERREKALQEFELFRQKWKDSLEKGDPYYNPNLSLDTGDFSINIKQSY